MIGAELSVRARVAQLFCVVLAACLLPITALAQSCYNNTNPNLVKNGDFESGSGSDFPPWNVSWPSSVDPNVNVADDNPHHGLQELKLGTIEAVNDVGQKVYHTSAGKIYTICFWLSSAPDLLGGRTTFDVIWNNVSVLEMTNSGTSPYQYYSLNVSAAGSDFIRFRERNDGGYYYLDDVAVQLCTGCVLPAEGEEPFAFRKH